MDILKNALIYLKIKTKKTEVNGKQKGFLIN